MISFYFINFLLVIIIIIISVSDSSSSHSQPRTIGFCLGVVKQINTEAKSNCPGLGVAVVAEIVLFDANFLNNFKRKGFLAIIMNWPQHA